MKKTFFARKIFLVYLFFIINILIVGLSKWIDQTPIVVWSLLSFVVLIPGFSLARLFRFKAKEIAGDLVIWLALGWLMALLLALFAILGGLTISTFATIYPVLTGLIFISAFLKDFIGHKDQLLNSWKIKFSWELFPYILMLVYLLAVAIIMLKGSIFKGGDAMYHLSLVRKVIENQSMTFSNLSYVKDQLIIAYAFPVWHVLIGLMARLGNNDIFLIWKDLTVPLFAMACIIWYWLGRKIFQTKIIAILGLLFFVFFYFNDRAGFGLTTLPIPHSLTNFILLPLTIALSVNYIFYSKSDWRQLVMIGVLSALMGAVHLTGYFYFLTIIIGLFVVNLITSFGKSDYKKIIRETILIIGPSMVFLAIFALILELKTHTVTQALNVFSLENYQTFVKHSSFSSLTFASKYAYIALPIVLLFVRKYRPLGLLLSLFLMPVIILNPWFSEFFVKTLGLIFVDRLTSSILWNFFIWALIFAVILQIFDQIMNNFSLNSRRFLNITLIIITIILLVLNYFSNFSEQIYNFIFSYNLDGKMIRHHWELSLGLFVLSVLLLIYQRKIGETKDFLKLRDPVNPGVLILCMIFILVVFTAPVKNNLYKSWKKFPNILTRSETNTGSYALSYIGGQETLDFIKTNISAKSVFDANSGFFYLPELADVYMSNYSSLANERYVALYSNKISISSKISILKSAKIQYLLVGGGENKKEKAEKVLDQNPEIFQKIYKGKSIIYKINLE